MRRLLWLSALLAAPARADATFALAPWEHWQHQGNGNGAVHLVVGDARLEAAPGRPATMKVAARGRELVEASLSIGEHPLRSHFLVEVEDGHHYTVEPDPCCFFQVGDDDAHLERRARCLPAEAECPAGLTGIEKFSSDAVCGPRRLTCLPPARLRLQGGTADVAVEGDDEARAFAAAYQRLALGRATPLALTVTPKGGRPFTLRVLLRHGARYTLILGAAPRLLRD